MPATITLSLENGRKAYKIGEPIVLQVEFVADEPGLVLNLTPGEPDFPLDDFRFLPMAGVDPWAADKDRGQHLIRDYAVIDRLNVGSPKMLTWTLNAVYQFDKPGDYQVQLATTRVSRGSGGFGGEGPSLTSNIVSLTIKPMSEAEDASRANTLEKKIRAESDLQTAQTYADELQWLTGDASTRVKLSLFLNPKRFYPFAVDVTRGLWIARNRQLVIAGLERDLRDPTQDMPISSSLLRLTVALKARLQSPYNPDSPADPLATEQIETEYLKLIAASLPQRRGPSLVDAAQVVLAALAKRNDTASPEFEAAREVLIVHFSEVDRFDFDELLRKYGDYLRDERMAAALRRILQERHDSLMDSERTDILKQLLRITPTDSRKDLVAEVCGERRMLNSVFEDVPLETLPEVDDCLKRKIDAPVAKQTDKLSRQRAALLIARFADSAIYDDLLKSYSRSANSWDKQSQGFLLAYFMRWDAKRGLPLLEKLLPKDEPNPDSEILSALDQAYSLPLEAVWLERLEAASPVQVGEAAWQLSRHGRLEDQAIIRARLDRFRTAWRGRSIPESEGVLEDELVTAVIYGKNWRLSDQEAAKLGEDCLSDECKANFSPTVP